MSKLDHAIRNALTEEHPEDIMVGYDEKPCRIREEMVLGEPARIGVAVRTDDGELFDAAIEITRNAAGPFICGKQQVGVDQRTHRPLTLRPGFRKSGPGTCQHTKIRILYDEFCCAVSAFDATPVRLLREQFILDIPPAIGEAFGQAADSCGDRELTCTRTASRTGLSPAFPQQSKGRPMTGRR